jgi:hypothetical protein
MSARRNTEMVQRKGVKDSYSASVTLDKSFIGVDTASRLRHERLKAQTS